MEFKEIVNDWHKEFPFLKKYTDRRLYFICKPYIMGFRIEKSCDVWDVPQYSVIFEILPLWDNNFENLPHPLLSVYTKRSGARNERYPQPIRFRDHKNFMQHAIYCTQEEFGSFVEEKIDFDKFWSYIYSNYIKPKFCIDKVNCFIILTGIAVYFNNNDLFNYIMKCVSYESKYRNKYNFSTLRKAIETYFEDRAQFIKTIEENCKRPKIAKLNVGEFVGVDEFEPPKSFWEKIQSVFRK